MNAGTFHFLSPMILFFAFIVGSFIIGLIVGYGWVQFRRWQMVRASGLEPFPFNVSLANFSRGMRKPDDVFQPKFKPMPIGFHPLQHARI